MRLDILKNIQAEKEITNAIILTHNIDFIFIQTVVLSAFRKCGHPSLTIFADAQCAFDTFSQQMPILDGLGTRYRVVPVAMKPGFRFHPKAILLSGQNSATLFVGSGNLTFGGWRENAEVWIHYQTQIDGTGPFAAFKKYLYEVIKLISLPDTIKAEIEEAFDQSTRGWAKFLSDSADLLGKAGAGPSLLELYAQIFGNETADHLIICCPYFDEEAEAIKLIAQKTKALRTTIYLQPERTNLLQHARESLGSNITLVPVSFFHQNKDGESREAFLHAKFIAIEKANRVHIFAGSANCSNAALIIPGAAGNAELVCVQEMSLDEFHQKYINELVELQGEFKLKNEHPDIQTTEKSWPVKILAARCEGRSLVVTYNAPEGFELSLCQVDDTSLPFSFVSPHKIILTVEILPHVIVLQGKINNNIVRSQIAWIDIETQLRSTARYRSLFDNIRTRITPSEWGIGAWNEILVIFCKNLEYMPPCSISGLTTKTDNEKKNTEPFEFTAEDVFSNSYNKPSLTKWQLPLFSSSDHRTQSLQQLMLRWFGLPITDDDANNDDTIHEPPDDDSDDEDDDGGDRPIPIKTKKKTSEHTITERDCRRALQLVNTVTNTMINQKYLLARTPAQLATDISIVSALFRVGYREEWIDDNVFFSATQKIWSALFFTTEIDPSCGVIEYRFKISDSPKDFVEQMQSATLSAALVAWSLAASDKTVSPENSRFNLASVLAVARLPWLWEGGMYNDIAREIAALVCISERSSDNQKELLESYNKRWTDLRRRGESISRLEKAIEKLTPAEICNQIRQNDLMKGEILWQGSAGFCVVTEKCKRQDKANVNVLRLQGKKGDGDFKASYTIPIKSLLDPEVVPLTEVFGIEQRKVLDIFLSELSTGFA